MIKSILIFTGLFFSISQPQIVEQSNFKLKNKKVYYERVFEVKNNNPEEIVKAMEERINSIFYIENIETNNNTINAKSSQTRIDYKKYRKKSMKTWRILNCHSASKISVQVAPNKYIVKVSDIEFTCVLPKPSVYKLNNESTKKGATFKNSKMTVNGLTYLDNYFKDNFDITEELSTRSD